MKIYITRHGQVAPVEFYDNVQFPSGDPPLTNIGRKQAQYLANYMKSIDFKGEIYSSPYARALETAEIIAETTNSKIIPWAPMREIMKTDEAAESFNGLTIEEIKHRYTHISKDTFLVYPWWSHAKESREDVFNRINIGFKELTPQSDVMFVGHGASAMLMIEYLNIPQRHGDMYNCCLSMYNTENKNDFKYMDSAHLPYNLLTQNTIVRAEQDFQKIGNILKQGIPVPDEIISSNSLKLLHIGDTASYAYPYYNDLIKKVRPDIIIHTGDLADEVKAGRIPTAKAEYQENVKKISQIFKNSNAEKIYIVPGNNDITEIIEKEMPFATIVPHDTQITISGITCTLTHSCPETSNKSSWFFYGHGFTGDTHKPEDNNLNGTCYFNAMWGPKVFLLSEKKVFSFIRPESV